MSDARGAAALLAVGAVAALAMLATTVLVAMATAESAARYRAERAQAEQLAHGALRQAVRALAAGQIETPGVGRPLTIERGVGSDGRFVAVAVSPQLPIPGWPAEGPAGVGDVAITRGARVRLEVVVGPDGRPRRAPIRDGQETIGEGRLVDLTADGWFRRGRGAARARLLVGAGRIVRLD